jgi:hypothetical protein
MATNKNLISIKPGSDAAKLIVQLGSKNRAESFAAQEAFAAFMGPAIQQVVEQAPVISNLYTTETYAEGTAPSLPLDVYYDIKDRNYIQVWSQSIAGGMATSEVKGVDEMFLSTYSLDTAVSMKKKYATEARLNVVAATMTRVAQEILIKQEINSANVLMKAVADAVYDADGSGALNDRQVLRATTAGTFQLDDFNRLLTQAARIRPSWVGGTPVSNQSVTHLVLSPEILEDIRAMAYQPMNTRGVPNSDESTALAAPESVRAEVWKTAGLASLFGVELVQSFELGISRRYNTLFSRYAGSTSYAGSSFNGATSEIVLALALNNGNSLVRLVEQGADGGTFSLQPDDQFNVRQGQIGFYGSLKEGRAVLDSRVLGGLIV